MAEITVLCEHLQAPSMCKDCRIARLEAEVAALKAQVEPTKQERVAVTRMGASEHVFVEFDGKIIYQFDDHEDEENDAEFHAKRYAAGLRLELEETK